MGLLCLGACKSSQKSASSPTVKTLGFADQKAIAYELMEKMKTDDLNANIEWFEKVKNDSAYILDLDQMKEAAYQLLDKGLIKEGLTILQLNVANFPDSQNTIDERVMYSVANQLEAAKMIKEAIGFLELNVEVFPESEKTYRSLADVYLADGRSELAIEYYKKSMALDPPYSLFNMVLRPQQAYSTTMLPKDSTDLFVVKGDMELDTAFVFLQGGPLLELSDEYYDPFYLMPNYEEMLRIYPLQSQMLNPHLIGPGHRLTKVQADEERMVSVEGFHQTISYLKNKGKMVFVIAHSFGSGLCQDYLVAHPNQADKMILMGSDLDEDIRSYSMRKEGTFIRWKNGVEPYETDFFRNIPEDFPYKNDLNEVLHNTGMLVKGHGKKRYTQLLKDKDLSKVVFVHARFDEANARTHPNDLKFLHSKGVPTIETYGDHHSMFSKEFMSNMYDYLCKGKLIKKAIACSLVNIIEEEGLEKGLAFFHSNKDSDNFHPINENQFNTLGYEFLQSGREKEAIEIFKLNVAAFPDSWNVYDSLGEAYRANDNIDLAIQNYKKSVEINPANQYGIDALKEMEAGK